MKVKTVVGVFLLVLVGAALTAALVVFGTSYLNHREKGDEASMLSLFSSEPKPKELQFVEVQNLVMTFRDERAREHYLLLDLAFTTHSDEQIRKTENLLPKIKGFTVDIFSSMAYSDVRTMSVMELHQLMMERYQAAFAENNIPMPFEDVTLSKMVFQ